MALSAVDEAFKEAGREEGLEIWRVENFEVVPVDPATYGQFYTGDSYIILYTSKKYSRNSSKYNIHFWLGSECSQGEMGVAAYKSVELDEALSNAATQHREVQNHESNKFLSYFTEGIRYLAGGLESGFRKVVRDQYEPRLIQIKGRKKMRVLEVQLAWDAMNSGDVFIFDDGLTIFVWNGKYARRMEKVKGLDVARRIRDEERGGRAQLQLIEEETMQRKRKFMERFHAVSTSGSPDDIQDPTDDATFEIQSRDLLKLYRVTEEEEGMNLEEAGSFPLKAELLDSNGTFVLDTGSQTIFVWFGRQASKNEKTGAFTIAMKLIDIKNYPVWTKVTSIRQGTETVLFKQNFTNWINKDETVNPVFCIAYESLQRPKPKKFDVSSMHQAVQHKPGRMIDDGTGMVRVWRIMNFELERLDTDLFGQFYSEECYIILYTYVDHQRKYILYYWLGQDSSEDERGAAATHVVAIDDVIGGECVHVRVVQNKEPEHFLLVFTGKMVVFSGSVPRGSVIHWEAVGPGGARLFHVRGRTTVNCRVVQVQPVATSLNSYDCFILQTADTTFIWLGMGCNKTEEEMAIKVTATVLKDEEPELLLEGEEPEEFWDALGGKEEYASDKWLAEVLPSRPPRLFQCSNASGNIQVEEIFDFAQVDLILDDVMLLDTYKEVFVWVGRKASEEEKKQSLTIATEYVQTDPTGRDPEFTKIIQVKQGFEPVNFTCHFHAWNPHLWSRRESFEAYWEAVYNPITSAAEAMEKYDDSRHLTYPQLLQNPEGIDMTRKEYYLHPGEFATVMGMSLEQYEALPKWRQMNIKKRVGLF